MARLVVEGSHHKDTCHDVIELHAQNTDIVLGSTVNTAGRAPSNEESF